MLGKLFKKKAKKAVSELKRMENKDQVEAFVGALWLLAYCSGGADATEKAKIDQVLRTNQTVSGYPQEVQELSARFVSLLETDHRIGRRAILREIEDVKGDQRDSEDILDAAVAIASADGEIDEPEYSELNAIANALGLRLENHL